MHSSDFHINGIPLRSQSIFIGLMGIYHKLCNTKRGASMAVLGIDLGGTKLAAALFSKTGEYLEKKIRYLEKRSGPAVGALITAAITELLSRAEQLKQFVTGVGVSIPGIYYARTGRVWAPNIPGWDNYPLLTELQELLKNRKIPVTIDSDRAAYILGETWLGKARGCRNALFVAVGTGIGAGILIDGQVLRGHQDIAGATGWMALDRPYVPKYKSCGCFEYYASGAGLARAALEFLQANPGYQGTLCHKTVEQLTGKDIFAAYANGDPIATKVMDQAIQFWGMAVANYISLFNPEKIILGGGIFGPAAQFLDRIVAEARFWAQPIAMQQVKVEVSALGDDAGLIGAARLAML
jgi:glucokinase